MPIESWNSKPDHVLGFAKTDGASDFFMRVCVCRSIRCYDATASYRILQLALRGTQDTPQTAFVTLLSQPRIRVLSRLVSEARGH